MKRKLGFVLVAVLLVLMIQPLAALAASVRATGDVTVRSSPSLNGSELGTLYSGNSLSYADASSVDSRGVRWYKVYYNGRTGWVSSRYSTLDSGYYYDPPTTRSDAYVKATGDVTVRSSPSLNGSERGTLYSGNTATYAGSGSTDSRGVRWYKIYFNGGTGWVSSRYSTLFNGTYYDDGYYYEDERGHTHDYDDWTYDYDYGSGYVRATGDVTVRSSPSLNGSEYGTLYSGNTAEYAGASATDSRGVRWYKIYFNGYTGWVSSRYSTRVSGRSSTPTYTYGSYVKATGDVTVRSSPSLNGSELGTLYSGNTATYADASSTDSRGVRWSKIYFKGGTGWVSSRYSTLYN